MAWENWESVHDERQIIYKVCGERSYRESRHLPSSSEEFEIRRLLGQFDLAWVVS